MVIWLASNYEYPKMVLLGGKTSSSGYLLVRAEAWWSNGSVLLGVCELFDVHCILILCSQMFVFDGIHVLYTYSMSVYSLMVAWCITNSRYVMLYNHYPHDLWVTPTTNAIIIIIILMVRELFLVLSLPVLSSHHQRVRSAKAGRCLQCRCCDVRLGGLVGGSGGNNDEPRFGCVMPLKFHSGTYWNRRKFSVFPHWKRRAFGFQSLGPLGPQFQIVSVRLCPCTTASGGAWFCESEPSSKWPRESWRRRPRSVLDWSNRDNSSSASVPNARNV